MLILRCHSRRTREGENVDKDRLNGPRTTILSPSEALFMMPQTKEGGLSATHGLAQTSEELACWRDHQGWECGFGRSAG